MVIPLHTSISIGLRTIPPSAGLARSPRGMVGHKVKKMDKSSWIITTKKDETLEEEINFWRNK